MDTLRLSDYFLSLRSAGAFNTFALQWADQNRNNPDFASFDDFMAHYDSTAVAAAFAQYAAEKHINKNDVKGEWVASWMQDETRKMVADTAHAIHAESYESYLSQLLSDKQYLEKLTSKALSEDRRRERINRHSEEYMGYLIKALIARNLYGNEYYYRIMKDEDEGLKKAIQTVKGI